MTPFIIIAVLLVALVLLACHHVASKQEHEREIVDMEDTISVLNEDRMQLHLDLKGAQDLAQDPHNAAKVLAQASKEKRSSSKFTPLKIGEVVFNTNPYDELNVGLLRLHAGRIPSEIKGLDAMQESQVAMIFRGDALPSMPAPAGHYAKMFIGLPWKSSPTVTQAAEAVEDPAQTKFPFAVDGGDSAAMVDLGGGIKVGAKYAPGAAACLNKLRAEESTSELSFEEPIKTGLFREDLVDPTPSDGSFVEPKATGGLKSQFSQMEILPKEEPATYATDEQEKSPMSIARSVQRDLTNLVKS